MLLALISDIHGNRHALEAVLAGIDREEADEIWCLGDVVGYGAEPDACCELIGSRCLVCLAGNHDMVVRGDLAVGEFSHAAAAAAQWTTRVLRPESRAFISKLQPSNVDGEFSLYHASPRDPVWEYVLRVDQAQECIHVQQRRISFVGHSHVACHFTVDEEGARGDIAEAREQLSLAAGRWLINPGSVGQPRDGDPRAAFLLLDTTAETATFHRVKYPIEEAAQAIVDAGLPPTLAERLFRGS